MLLILLSETTRYRKAVPGSSGAGGPIPVSGLSIVPFLDPLLFPRLWFIWVFHPVETTQQDLNTLRQVLALRTLAGIRGPIAGMQFIDFIFVDCFENDGLGGLDACH